METRSKLNSKKRYYATLPNLGYATRKSEHEYKYAVIARVRIPEGNWGEWYVARWSTKLELANKHANYLTSGCPSVKKHYYEFETMVVPVEAVDW